MKLDLDKEDGLKLMQDALLGEVMLRNRLITREQLEESLRHQRATGTRIGEALVDLKLCSWSDVEYALQLQTQMRRYAS